MPLMQIVPIVRESLEYQNQGLHHTKIRLCTITRQNSKIIRGIDDFGVFAESSYSIKFEYSLYNLK